MDTQAPPLTLKPYLLAGLGMIGGGIIGSLLFWVAYQAGIYFLGVLGAGVGIGCGYGSRIKSFPLAIASGLVSFGLCVFWIWKVAPFIADPSFGYFVKNLANLDNGHRLMLIVGVIFGVWFGLGRDRQGNFSAAAKHTGPTSS